MTTEKLYLEVMTSELCLRCCCSLCDAISCSPCPRTPHPLGSTSPCHSCPAPCHGIGDETRTISRLISYYYIIFSFFFFLMKVGILLLENGGIYWMLCLLKVKLKFFRAKEYTDVCAEVFTLISKQISAVNLMSTSVSSASS